MFQAQLLIRPSASDLSVFSPWFDRGGDHLRATVDVVALQGATLTVKVFTKNREDTGDGVEVEGVSIVSTTVGRSAAEWDGLEELVRYEFTVGTASANWVLFRMLDPVWFDAVST